jgi:hypothetical protein
VTRVLSYQAANAVAEGKLKIVLADYEPEPLLVNLVYLEQNLLPRRPAPSSISWRHASATVSQRLQCRKG